MILTNVKQGTLHRIKVRLYVFEKWTHQKNCFRITVFIFRIMLKVQMSSFTEQCAGKARSQKVRPIRVVAIGEMASKITRAEY